MKVTFSEDLEATNTSLLAFNSVNDEPLDLIDNNIKEHLTRIAS
jgi:hypothetical protein